MCILSRKLDPLGLDIFKQLSQSDQAVELLHIIHFSLVLVN